MKKKVLLVGLGMVGFRFCQRLLEKMPPASVELTVIGEEEHPAYDRVQLSSYFQREGPDALYLAPLAWYREQGIELRLGQRAIGIEREKRQLILADGARLAYDVLVLATGSAPFVPPLAGVHLRGVFVYRTLKDLEEIARYAAEAKTAAVMGGGLLGLEAAKILHDKGLETHVLEAAPRLMPRQLDELGAGFLKEKVERLGLKVHCGQLASEIEGEAGRIAGICFRSGERLRCDMLVISAGIKARDELAREAGLALGPRGGIAVDASLLTSDPHIAAIGECVSFDGQLFGLVAPGYRMAEVLAERLAGHTRSFQAYETSVKLKLLGVDVISIGDPFASGEGIEELRLVHEDEKIYKKLIFAKAEKKVLGGILVGDSSTYGKLYQAYTDGQKIDFDPVNLLVPGAPTSRVEGAEAAPDSLVCSCECVQRSTIAAACRGASVSLKDLKAQTRAGTGCGSCVPVIEEIMLQEAMARGEAESPVLCPHFAHPRPVLYQLIRGAQLKSFAAVRERFGQGHGCEICKPAVASILASLWNEPILERSHVALQDSNDRYLANIQVNGSYSVVPRIPAGEITPEKLRVIADVAARYQLYSKITGGQRIDLFGARLEQLPFIWRELLDAGFESGHAYGKAVRTVKSCVGSTWCRFGVQDSVSMAIRIEERYKGIRAPHKIKMAVSGCARECAEAQSKDVGVIASEKGWNLYVGGNGGMRPQHAQLFATDLSDSALIRAIDRFLIYYIRTADRLTRTATWLRRLPGGLEHLRGVIFLDSYGLGAELDQDMEALVSSYRCEWRDVLEDPEKLKMFRPFVNADRPDPSIRFTREREQLKPLLVPMEER